MIDIKKPNPPLKFNSNLIPLKNVKYIIFHHVVSETAGIQAVHNYHLSKSWAGIGYNYFINFDGTIYEGRGLNVGAHTKNYNDKSIGIVLQGNLETQKMTDEQLKASVQLAKYFIKKYDLSKQAIKKHKDFTATACPGKNFREKELLELVTAELKPDNNNSNTIYYVQVGAFKNYQNAKNLLEKVKKQGYSDAFIKTLS